MNGLPEALRAFPHGGRTRVAWQSQFHGCTVLGRASVMHLGGARNAMDRCDGFARNNSTPFTPFGLSLSKACVALPLRPCHVCGALPSRESPPSCCAAT
ncbi:MAG: hypothetical protein EON49_05095 [Acidovorax sp.]|nr:MAG: hypothetical protein EON49_05095 [Acidovorax sp.]